MNEVIYMLVELLLLFATSGNWDILYGLQKSATGFYNM